MKIVTIECRNCSGRGYHETTVKETKEDPPFSGKFIVIEVTYQEQCGACDGDGFIQISSED